MRSNYLIYILVFCLFSCKKKEEEKPVDSPQYLQNGILVLNEGLFQHNNAALSWVSLQDNTVSNDFFTQKTGRMLGDTGNDLKRYGGKIYIVVNVSSTIEVLDAQTGNFIKQIQMLDGGTAKQPRFIDFYQGKAFVVCFDGYVDVLDTASLTIEKRIAVGTNPDGIVRSGNYLYVSNSGGLNTPLMDSTVSVINGSTLLEEKKIVVGTNPGSIEKDLSGNIYVVARGNYGSIPSRLVKIDGLTQTKASTYSFDASGIEAINDNFLISYYSASQTHVGLFDPTSGNMVNPDFLNLSSVQTLFGMQFRAADNSIYICDAMGYTTTGFVRQFNLSGTEIRNFAVGLNPGKLLFFE